MTQDGGSIPEGIAFSVDREDLVTHIAVIQNNSKITSTMEVWRISLRRSNWRQNGLDRPA